MKTITFIGKRSKTYSDPFALRYHNLIKKAYPSFPQACVHDIELLLNAVVDADPNMETNVLNMVRVRAEQRSGYTLEKLNPPLTFDDEVEESTDLKNLIPSVQKQFFSGI